MMRIVGLVCLIAGMTQGCAGINEWGEVRTAEHRDLPPITVSGTTYKIYELSRSTNMNVPPREDPNATFAVYAIVGPGRKLYCGTSAAGCEKAIRKFNSTPYDAKQEVLDGM